MLNLGRIGWVATLYIKEKNRSDGGLDRIGEDPIGLDWIGRTKKNQHVEDYSPFKRSWYTLINAAANSQSYLFPRLSGLSLFS